MANPEFPCAPCRRIFRVKQAYDDHCKTPAHRQTLDTLRSGSASIPTIPPGSLFCDACFTVVKEKEWPRHVSTPRHSKAVRFQKYQDAKREAEGNKGGVEVSPEEVDFGLVEVEQLSEKSYGAHKVQELTVKAGAEPCLIASGMFTTGKKSAGQARFTVQDFDSRSVYIAPGQSRKIPVHFLPRNVLGVHTDTLTLTILVIHDSQNFDKADSSTYTLYRIQRAVRGEVASSVDRETLAPTAPYIPNEERVFRAPRPDDSEVVRVPKGIAKEEFPENAPWAGKLPFYRPRPFLKQTIENQPIGMQIKQVRRMIGPVVSEHNYGEFWETLLQAEQLQEDIDLRNHDVEGATMRKGNVGGVWFLTVPGLIDRSPSVLKGDKIRIRISGQSNSRWFEGFVSVVHGTDVGLRFHDSFKPAASDTFDVQFTLSSVSIRRQIQALREGLARPGLLFPKEMHGDRSNELASWQLLNPLWFSPSIEHNPEQRQAVLSIVYNTSGQAPFILYGPPGTGKTVTIVEACKHLVHYGHDSRLLLTAPSNAAADLLIERLSDLLEADEMFRLNAPSRQTAEISTKVKQYSRIKDGSTFMCPLLEELKRYKVIVSTCISASILAGVGLPKGHFSHIFVDEAGQATEPQTFLPLSLAGDRTKVVLAGDPHQLGPVIHSHVSSNLGLQTSLLERLMSLPDYVETNHKARGITYVKLTKNYRNHPAILKLPNQLFYKGELESCAPHDIANSLQGWDGWMNTGFPVMFHAVEGTEMREGKSPSCFNVDEVTAVKGYVNRLLNKRSGAKITQNDIGIITPYASQVKKLRQAMYDKRDLTIDSVEKFQGSERSMIIISTVRSNEKYLANDARFSLGFLKNEKRLNAALTRARAGLIVIGNPKLLALDKNWRKLLLWCWDNNAWVGAEWDPEEREKCRNEAYDPAKDRASELDRLAADMLGMSVY
ncbi:hypothetical protein NBRC10512_001591 [Rhodotorula toruloides]|uniref:RNA helicase n=2 Tax=Rhodotorula toruloides TaxID=5286 RepID=A0A061B918_RHOTO|nr:RNA helicase [Rhodotorula toruloides NP11]EMS23151.1 RNA helicase [Rhodotorula toruloides NP11]CDR46418.1 RHTO0S12e04236g1_1 [Rhodotorula toruloides]